MSADPQNTIEQLKRKASRFPTDRQVRFELGAALHAQGDYSAAIKELLPVMEHRHCSCRAMRLLIEAFDAIGQPERAALIKERFRRECGGDAGESSAPMRV